MKRNEMEWTKEKEREIDIESERAKWYRRFIAATERVWLSWTYDGGH